MKTITISLAALATYALFGAAPAEAQFSGFHKPKIGSGGYATGTGAGSLIPADQSARVNRVRSGAGADQFKITKKCVDDVNVGTDDSNGPQLLSRRRDVQYGNIEYYGGGICSGNNRRETLGGAQ